MDWLENLQAYWVWLTLGVVLAGAEMLLPGVYLIWLALVAIAHGSGRVKLGDSEWIARGPDVAAGECVRVSGSEGANLLVEPLNLLPDEGMQPPS